ncbi:hypothetical protein TNCT_690021 [Trichonephila clavata]|uniref:Uncharacterized protein n=1 Tax=Trichonephila clavata TaxID=2740835 RepID=A0A8X6KXA1_TRICU|nr:hypothetical protein TNCT_690021 [Trichonephila clavata]
MHALNKSGTLCEARPLFSENLVPTRNWASCKVSLLVLGAADGVNLRKGASLHTDFRNYSTVRDVVLGIV